MQFMSQLGCDRLELGGGGWVDPKSLILVCPAFYHEERRDITGNQVNGYQEPAGGGDRDAK